MYLLSSTVVHAKIIEKNLLFGFNKCSPYELYNPDRHAKVSITGAFRAFAGMGFYFRDKADSSQKLHFEIILENTKIDYTEDYHGLGTQYFASYVASRLRLGIACYPLIYKRKYFEFMSGVRLNILLYSIAGDDLLIPAATFYAGLPLSLGKHAKGGLFYRVDIPVVSEFRQGTYVIVNNFGFRYQL